ncbi:MAG: hypothetical protein IKL68_05915 [Clostridia bacterium]|nr:hypothetical protein [Clostridia bacterium]
MRRIAKKIVKILPVVIMLCIVFVDAFAANTNIGVPNGPSGTASTTIKRATGKVWATVITIVQILAVGSVVFAGVRYMVASADQKADIKRSLGTLAIGAALVFGATTIIRFVVNSANQVMRR